MTTVQAIVFDLGGVLIDWDPRYLYRKLIPEEDQMEQFLKGIVSGDWNEEQDGGRSLEEGTRWLVERFPAHESLIRAYYGRWEEMLGGYFEAPVAELKRLKQGGSYPLYALTNWSAETFPVALERYEFLHWFDGILVSGREGIRKPFPEIYQLLIRRFGLYPPQTLFIDDNKRNVEAACRAGFLGVLLESPALLGEVLDRYGIQRPPEVEAGTKA